MTEREMRINFVHQMHDFIINLGDEEIYEVWIMGGVPDEPCEEDFEYFADDATNFRELCELFGKLVAVDMEGGC